MADTFVGRETELTALCAAFERASGGHTQLLIAVGEPGVGKTRLAERWSQEHVERGPILWARCYEHQGTPPFWLWVQPLRAYLRSLDDGEVQDIAGGVAPSLVGLLPELSERLPGVAAAPEADDSVTARFRLYDAVTRLPQRVARDTPLVLILDDLHWADEASLLLLEYLARALRDSRLLMVGTYRDVQLGRTHHLARTLSDLTREQLFERLALPRLAEQEAATLTEAVAGRPIASNLASAMFDRTDGNPLFVTEMARVLASSGGDEVGQRIPEGIREVIGTRLEGLSDARNATLRWAALMRTPALSLLRELQADVTEQAVIDGVSEALAADVLIEAGDQADSYNFAHALIQETVVSELLAAEQVRMHAAIAEALTRRADARRDVDAAQLAYHSLRAEPVLDTHLVRSACGAAGDEAMAAHAFEAAQEWYGHAVDVGGAADLGARHLYGLARSRAALMDDLADSPAILLPSFEHFVATNDHAMALEVASVAEWLAFRTSNAGTTSMVERAL